MGGGKRVYCSCSPRKSQMGERMSVLSETLSAASAHVPASMMFSLKKASPTYFSCAKYLSLLSWDFGLLYLWALLSRRTILVLIFLFVSFFCFSRSQTNIRMTLIQKIYTKLSGAYLPMRGLPGIFSSFL